MNFLMNMRITWKSKDLVTIVVFSILGLLYAVYFGQLGYLLTNIPGSNIFFCFGWGIWVSLALLFFENRRWNYLKLIILYCIISMPTCTMGAPFDIFPRIPLVLTAIQIDLLFCSLYPFFKDRKKIVWLLLLIDLNHVLVDYFFRFLLYPIFYSSEYTTIFTSIVLSMLPVAIFEYLIGAILGYKIFERINTIK